MSPRIPEAAGPSVHRATGASLVAVALVLVAFGAVLLLHVVRGGDVDPLRQVMSEYANGSHGPAMTLTFYALGVSALALGLRLRGAIIRTGVTRLFPWLLALAGVCLIASGVFEVERALVPDTLEEVIHSDASIAAFVLMVTAMLLFSLACRGDDRWWNYRWISLALAVAATAAAAATPLSGGTGWSGAVQRLLGGTVLVWLLFTALHVRGKAFAAA